MKKFWLLQFAANALLIFGFYEWLGVRDSRTSQLILSFVLGLALVAGTVFLHSRTFHMKPLRFAVILLIFALVFWGLSLLPVAKAGLWVASTLTHAIRKPVKPDTVTRLFGIIRAALQWVVVPLVLLQKREPMFWLRYLAIVFGFFWLPSVLIQWTPKLESTTLQVISFVLRFGLAYCLITTGFATLWRFTSSGSPVESQPNTAALP